MADSFHNLYENQTELACPISARWTVTRTELSPVESTFSFTLNRQTWKIKKTFCVAVSYKTKGIIVSVVVWNILTTKVVQVFLEHSVNGSEVWEYEGRQTEWGKEKNRKGGWDENKTKHQEELNPAQKQHVLVGATGSESERMVQIFAEVVRENKGFDIDCDDRFHDLADEMSVVSGSFFAPSLDNAVC